VRIRLYAGNSVYPALLVARSAAVTTRPVRTISREVLVTPQRPYAGHPGDRMMRWSHLHGDMQGSAVQSKACFRSRHDASKALSEIPCRVSSDLHEWRNDLNAVSTRGSVKLQSR
jgi:hypothetical protein